MGRAAGYALATDPAVQELTLVDRDPHRAAELAGWLRESGDCRIAVAPDVPVAVTGQDAVAAAMPWQPTASAIDVALAARVPLASITRPPYPALAELTVRARAAGGVLLLPIGLEPGLTELLAVAAAARLDRVEEVRVRCGGIPQTPRGPLHHVSFFGGERVDHLPVAQRPALTLRDGRPVEVPRFSGVERCEVAGVGTLQAYHDGMVPWLGRHPLLRGVTASQKTLRWPGFAEAVGSLAGLGLLSEEPVDVDGVPVRPLRVTERVVAPQVRPRPGERDLVVLEVNADGRRDGRPATVVTRLVDRYDPGTGLSAVARTTGFTLAAATRLLAAGELSAPGWRAPHLALSTAQLRFVIGTLTARGAQWSPPSLVGAPEHSIGRRETG